METILNLQYQCVKFNTFRGNLGNKMFTYMQLYILRVKYGLDVYITENVFAHLQMLFENVSGKNQKLL